MICPSPFSVLKLNILRSRRLNMAEEEEDIEEEEVQGPPPSKLVFVNHVDSYTGSSIAKVLKHQCDN